MAKKEKNMFIDKKDMYNKVCKYKAMCERAKKYNAPKPVVPESLAKDVFAIAESISKRHNFSGYPFREDMVMDGVEHVLKYIHTFNTEKFDNVFGWVYTIVWQCFGNRINAEKKQLYIKFKEGSNFIHELSYIIEGGTKNSTSVSGVDVQYINDFIDEYEEKNKLGKFKEQK